MRILLVNPQMAKGWRPYTLPPVGLCYLKAGLVKAGFKDVKVLDASDFSIGKIRSYIKDYKPDVVGVTCFTEARHNSLDVARVAKEVNSSVTTMLGGVHPTFMYKQILENYGFVDIVVIGEGEETIVELAKSLSTTTFEAPRGLAFRGLEGECQISGSREKIKNLDSLPFPDYSDLQLDRYKDTAGPIKDRPLAPIVTSRGCPFQCAYCSAKAMWGSWRHRSIQSVIEELTYLVRDYGYDTFIIIDDIFSADAKRCEELCNNIISNKLNIKWRIQTRTDAVTLSLLQLMKDAGCVGVGFGVESGSPLILKNLNKRESTEGIVQAFEWCHKVDLDATFNVIIGSPGETAETLNETKDLIRKCRPPYVSTANLRIYPGTPLWNSSGYNESWFLDREETLFYTKAMDINEMYRHNAEFVLLQARLGGLKGYFDLYKLGLDTLERFPYKILRAMLGVWSWIKIIIGKGLRSI